MTLMISDATDKPSTSLIDVENTQVAHMEKQCVCVCVCAHAVCKQLSRGPQGHTAWTGSFHLHGLTHMLSVSLFPLLIT